MNSARFRHSRRMRRCLVLALCLVPALAMGQSVALKYDAFIGVAHAGEIRVQVARDAQSYQVRGQARARGLVELLKDTRGWFSAAGRLESGQPLPETYEYYQKDKSKERFISVAGGQLTYVKDGASRPPVAALPGTDLVTALWVEPRCEDLTEVHTGRSAYAFTLLEQAEGVCRFRVKEDDEDEPPFSLDVEYGERGGVRVPVSIRSTGGWAGRIVLVE